MGREEGGGDEGGRGNLCLVPLHTATPVALPPQVRFSLVDGLGTLLGGLGRKCWEEAVDRLPSIAPAQG